MTRLHSTRLGFDSILLGGATLSGLRPASMRWFRFGLIGWWVDKSIGFDFFIGQLGVLMGFDWVGLVKVWVGPGWVGGWAGVDLSWFGGLV